MRFRSIQYPGFILYELLRFFVLLRQGAASGPAILPITWYASAPMLCVVPILFFMLAINEDSYALWLPLIALIKAISAISFVLYLLDSVPNALGFALSGDLSYIHTPLFILALIIADIALGLWCRKRGRAVCK